MPASHVQVLSGSTLLLALATLLLLWRWRLQQVALRALRLDRDNVLAEERRRIAADIHDDLGQNLLTLKLDTIALLHAVAGAAAEQPLPPFHVLQPQLEHMTSHIDNTIRSLRTIINGLRPLALEQGLRCAVERQLHEFARANGIGYALEMAQYCDDAPGGADPAEAAMFRVLQESLANIARHAEATEVRIALARNASELRLTVHDNGVGLPPGPSCRGRGLHGMEQRVTDAGGWLALASTPGHGTALTISIPLADAANQAGYAGDHSARLASSQPTGQNRPARAVGHRMFHRSR